MTLRKSDNMPLDPNHTSLSEGISPEGYIYGLPEKIPVERPEWKPWHKPRKQWLRDKQWCTAIQKLKGLLRLHERPFSYLSLPGDELLDFRVITKLCGELEINKVKLVGFNDCKSSGDSGRRLTVAKNEVFTNDVVVEHSDVHSDDFKKISNLDSIAYKFADEKGPYDVINLDLCDSFSGTSQDESYYKATLNLLNLQIQRRTEPWLFLLTTRADKAKVNLEDIQHFGLNIQHNVSLSSNFKLNFEENYLIEECNSDFDFQNHARRTYSPHFEKLFGLFLGKWLLRITHTSQRWSLELLDSYWYRTNRATAFFPNMLSLAFLFQPIPVQVDDPSGLAQIERSRSAVPNETAQAIDMLNKMNQLKDVDLYLHQNKSEFEEALQNSEALLYKAGYVMASYRQWAMSVLPPFHDQ